MTLLKGSVGGCYRVLGLSMERDAVRRLQTLGMTVGCRLILLGKRFGGTVLVSLRGSRYALGGGFSRRITVESEQEL